MKQSLCTVPWDIISAQEMLTIIILWSIVVLLIRKFDLSFLMEFYYQIL